MLYKGSCHCGNMKFEVEGELTQLVSCNCSICARKGALLWSVPRDKLRLLGPARASAATRSTPIPSRIASARPAACTPMPRMPATRENARPMSMCAAWRESIWPRLPVIEFDGRAM